MKILHLISSGGMYGAENVVAALALELERAGHSVSVGVFENTHQPDSGVADEFARRGVRVARIPCKGRFDWRSVSYIRQLIKSGGFEVVHTHGYKSDIYGFLAARPLHVPLVATCHLWTRQSVSLRIYELIDALVLRHAQKAVGVSEAITKTLSRSGVPGHKLSTIYNGTDFPCPGDVVETLKGELGASDRLLIGSVGRLEAQKGFEYLIRAAKLILSEVPSALFVIVGEGSQRTRLSGLIHEMGLESHVLLVGQRNDMPRIYASLDVFVLASIDEGMPMAILEALAASCPVVATRVGAVEKLVLAEKTGLLVEPQDTSAIYSAVLRCLQERSFARELGREGMEHVRKNFSIEAMTVRYLKIYGEVVCCKKPVTGMFKQKAEGSHPV